MDKERTKIKFPKRVHPEQLVECPMCGHYVEGKHIFWDDFGFAKSCVICEIGGNEKWLRKKKRELR